MVTPNAKSVFRAIQISLLHFVLLFSFAFAAQTAFAWEGPVYSDLQLKNHDDMQGLMRSFLQRAEAADTTDEALPFLERAFVVLLSRPNYDNVLGALVDSIKTPLNDAGAYVKVTNDITSAALRTVRDDSLKPAERATALFLLTNLLSDLKSELFGKNGVENKKLVERIQNEKLAIPKDVAKWLRNKSMMSTPRSPSEIAKDILADYAKRKKVLEAEEKAALAAEAEARAQEETQEMEQEMSGENAPVIPKESDKLDSQNDTEVDLHLNSPKGKRPNKK
jgi:hypothetical protein